MVLLAEKEFGMGWNTVDACVADELNVRVGSRR